MQLMRGDPKQGAAYRGFVAYSTLLSIQLHFKQKSFDAFKYNFKAGAKAAQFENRRDRYFYEKIGTKYRNDDELRQFFMANVLAGVTWIGNMDEEHYTAWLAQIQSMSYRFTNELKVLKRACDANDFTFNDMLIPSVPYEQSLIVSKFLANDVSLETIASIDILVGFIKRLQKQVSSDPLGLFEDVSNRVVKYEPFLLPLIKIDRLRTLVVKTFR